MFESLSYLALQQYWWFIISLLAGLLSFLLFVQGGQTLIYTLGKSDSERTLLINSLGRKWEFTFTTLVTFGGAFFASFPLFYATSFGGAYWVWMAILFCFIIQAIAYEFRSKPNNIFGHKTYELFLLINGTFGTILLGTAISTFFYGSGFSLNEYNQVRWENSWRGLEAVLNLQNVTLGLAIYFLARTLGILYFINNVSGDTIRNRSFKQLWFNSIAFVVLFLIFSTRLLFSQGYAYDPETHTVFIEKYKYLHNFIQMPTVFLLFLVGVLSVLFGILITLIKKANYGIWFSGTGTILTVLSLFLIAGYNNTCFYPSTFDLQSSLTIENASSSRFTLTIMSYVSLIIPFVATYIFFAWRAINKVKISGDELENETHTY